MTVPTTVTLPRFVRTLWPGFAQVPLTTTSPPARGARPELISYGANARELVVSAAAVGKHIGGILTKLDLPPAQETHRRVLAVLAYLRG